MTDPCILFRSDRDTEEEFNAASSVWGDRLFRYRSDIPENSLVVGRYSCLPFYRELEDELAVRGSRLLNTYAEHQFIANMGWYEVLHETDPSLTPRTWFDVGWANAPDTEHGWVVKGKTNSRKFRWKTHMFASDRDSLRQVMRRLHEDTMISEQGLVVREYVPLRVLEEGINDLPFTNEWRCFFLGTKLLTAGFYWTAAECAEGMGQICSEALSVATRAAEALASSAQGIVVDVAETQRGGWTVIEVNDLQMSGLSENDPTQFYQNLREALHGR